MSASSLNNKYITASETITLHLSIKITNSREWVLGSWTSWKQLTRPSRATLWVVERSDAEVFPAVACKRFPFVPTREPPACARSALHFLRDFAVVRCCHYWKYEFFQTPRLQNFYAFTFLRKLLSAKSLRSTPLLSIESSRLLVTAFTKLAAVACSLCFIDIRRVVSLNKLDIKSSFCKRIITNIFIRHLSTNYTN